MLAAFLAFLVCSSCEFSWPSGAARQGPRSLAGSGAGGQPRRLRGRGADRCVVEGDREVEGVGACRRESIRRESLPIRPPPRPSRSARGHPRDAVDVLEGGDEVSDRRVRSRAARDRQGWAHRSPSVDALPSAFADGRAVQLRQRHVLGMITLPARASRAPSRSGSGQGSRSWTRGRCGARRTR